MKKEYKAPEWEMVSFSGKDLIIATTGCDANCSDDCTHCYYLVCEPEDVIIGG